MRGRRSSGRIRESVSVNSEESRLALLLRVRYQGFDSPRSIPVANPSFDISTVEVTLLQHLEEPISIGSSGYTLL